MAYQVAYEVAYQVAKSGTSREGKSGTSRVAFTSKVLSPACSPAASGRRWRSNGTPRLVNSLL